MNYEKRKIFWNTLCSSDGIDRNRDYNKLISTLSYPDKLCKFRSVNEYSISALQENTLYFSSADKYDDPFDCYLHIDWNKIQNILHSIKDTSIEELLQAMPSLQPFSKECLQHYFNNIFSKEMIFNLNDIRSLVQRTSYAISFSDNYLNENLWLKYANNHRGFCLIYDLCCKDDIINNNFTFLQNNFHNTANYLFPIYYSNESYNATDYALNSLVLAYHPFQVERNILEYMVYPNNKITPYEAYKISLIKNKCHEYDNEWRIIPANISYGHRYTPIIWKPSKIIVGLRTPPEHISLILRSAQIAKIQNIYRMGITSKNKLGIFPLYF